MEFRIEKYVMLIMKKKVGGGRNIGRNRSV